jgi:5-methyltetrahydrofolate--homocysteine methyltransferase
MKDAIFEEMKVAFNDYDEDEVLELISKALDEGVGALEIMNHLSSLLEVIGEQFSIGELFLPDMVMAGDLMDGCMQVLKPVMMNSDDYVPSDKKILFGMVRGDVHDIGKNMVKMLWMSSGYEVIDLGTDVPAEAFLEKANEVKPDLIALSSAMSTTVPSMKDTIDLLKSRGYGEEIKIMAGGGSANADLSDELGASCYGGDDAYEALQSVKQLLG